MLRHDSTAALQPKHRLNYAASGGALQRLRAKGPSALNVLEHTPNAPRVQTIELDPPPRPVPRRERAFLRVGAVCLPPPPRPERPIVLDGFVLLEASHAEDPEHAERVVLEGCAITTVVEEDLAFFTKLTHLDLGDNHVQLAQLGALPALKELHLDCNGLTDIMIPADAFLNLEVLNLSFNGLRPHAILSLADLPAIRELDLSGNKLPELPESLAAFHTLRRLSLDDNVLDTSGAFLALATLPRLASLSMARNNVEQLPANLPEGGFPALATLSLVHNRIADEADLLPLLKLRSLTTLLLYGNPCIRRGGTSGDFAYVMGEQRGVNVVSLAPPPPPPPSKLGGPGPARVAEPPTRRQISAPRKAPPPVRVRAAPPDPTEDAEDEDTAGAGPSFFLTGVDVRGTRAQRQNAAAPPAEAEEGEESAFARLALELSRIDVDDTMDMPAAVAALRRAVDRVDDGPPLTGDVRFLQRTATSMGKVRSKYVPPPPPPLPGTGRTDGLTAGAARSARDASTLDTMNATLGEMQKRLARGGGNNPHLLASVKVHDALSGKLERQGQGDEPDRLGLRGAKPVLAMLLS